MDIINLRWLYLVAVLHLLAFSTILCEIYEGTGKEESFLAKDTDDVVRIKRDASETLSDEAMRQFLVSTDGFLAGQHTPVWIAHRYSFDKPVNYTKLKNGIIQEAINHWKSGGSQSYPRARRNVNENSNIVKKLRRSTVESSPTPTPNVVNDAVLKLIAKETNRKRSWTANSTIVYPSVLVMMDYTFDWPEDQINQKKLIMGMILYSLAFWNGVDLQVRYIKSPKVRLRISGIIIGLNKAATPYVYDNDGTLGLAVRPAFVPMLTYWRNLVAANPGFPQEAYDIVATMTDSRASIFRPTKARATAGPTCNMIRPDAVLFSDDLSFTGIQKAVHEIGHVLGEEGHDGDTADCPKENGQVMASSPSAMGRKWSQCSLTHISTGLNRIGWCFEVAKQFDPPGNPIETILPGKLMSASKQCQARGWTAGNVCWNYFTCDALYCSNNHIFSSCTNSGAPADGTSFNTRQMCLNGQVVSNDIL